MDGTVGADAERWARAVGGDGESFAVLFDRHQQRVYRHACRLVDTVQDAEDVTAAAFLELWRRRLDVRLVDGSVLPWLLVTTSNLARNVRRGVRRHRAFIDRLPRARVHSEAGESKREPLDSDLGVALRLSGADLRLVTLVMLEGYPLAEAADVVAIGLAGGGVAVAADLVSLPGGDIDTRSRSPRWCPRPGPPQLPSTTPRRAPLMST